MLKHPEYFIALLLTLAIQSCSSLSTRKEAIASKVENGNIEFAKGFGISSQGGKTLVTVFDPWHKGRILAEFVLTKGKAAKGEIHIPMDSVAIFSATQLNCISKLHLLNAIMGVSDSRYLQNKNILRSIAAGRITEMASGGTYFTEKILKLKPKVIFYSPYENSRPLPPALAKMLFIPYLDYMESDPLGRAEWIKFSAAFFDMGNTADSIFDKIAQKYTHLKKLTDTLTYLPTVFSDKYFGGRWYVAGGKSYVARLFADAGADYLWKNLDKEGSIPFDFETVYQKAANADYWRIVGTFGSEPSYKTLAAENELYTGFKAFRIKHIIYCDPQTTAYFEQSPLEPQIVLADFIKAFHPKLLPDYQPKYFKILP